MPDEATKLERSNRRWRTGMLVAISALAVLATLIRGEWSLSAVVGCVAVAAALVGTFLRRWLDP